MSERLYTVLGALGTLLALIMLVAPAKDSDEVSSRPLSTDKEAAGLWALQQWAEQGGVHTARLGRRYDTLATSGPWPATGNLIVIVLPQRVEARARELQALHEWLMSGNSAVVLAADGDPAQWSERRAAGSTDALLDALGFGLVVSDVESDRDFTETVSEIASSDTWPTDRAPVEIEPTTAHAVTRGVTTVEIRRVPLFDLHTRLQPDDGDQVVLALLRVAESSRPVLWQTSVGAGTLWVSRYASLFSNRHLGTKNNARLAANLLAAGLRGGGWLIFDDMHQGASALYDPSTFFSDTRVWASLGFLIALWLAWVAGRAQRLAPFLPQSPDLRTTDFANVVSGLFARRLSAEAAAGALLAHFFDELRTRYRMAPSNRPDWPLLERLYTGPPSELERFRQLAKRLEHGSRVDLNQFAHHLSRLRKQLL